MTAGSRAELADLLQTITERARFLTTGGTPPDPGLTAPPRDSGCSGPVVVPDGLTVTLSVGASLFDDRFGLAGREARTAARPWTSSPTTPCAARSATATCCCRSARTTADAVTHAVREIARATRGGMQVRWRQDGFVSPPRPSGTPRNLMGFKDGTRNPDTPTPRRWTRLVWARGGAGEPAWVAGGSYHVVRVIRMLVEFWDRVNLHEQENMIGRRRDTGAPLTASHEFDDPHFENDPTGDVIQLDAHIRLANPRTARRPRRADAAPRLQLRRRRRRERQSRHGARSSSPSTRTSTASSSRCRNDWPVSRSPTTSRRSAAGTTSRSPESAAPPTGSAAPCSPERDQPVEATRHDRAGTVKKRKKESCSDPPVCAAPRRPRGCRPRRRGRARRRRHPRGAPAVAYPGGQRADHSDQTVTPIKHLVVIFDENISFDHYFGTYPNAANTDGTPFTASPKTPKANTLATSGTLDEQSQPVRAEAAHPGQAVTCDQNHSYAAEQAAVDGGKMDQFVQKTETDTCTGAYAAPGLVMDYYDGNTVTGLWNYAQNYAMSDNSWDTTFGPSTPGALNLISGQTHGGTPYDPKTGAVLTTSTAVAVGEPQGVGTVIGDPDPAYDDCSDNDHTASSAVVGMSGRNVGDLLNSRGVTWGWFQGGFTPTTAWNGQTGTYAKCDATTANIGGATPKDYSPHHSPFQYYKSTSNPHHLPPTSVKAIGHTDQANHQYDLTSFDTALKGNNLPAVSFLKAPEAQDGHAGYSDPIDEQKFLVNEINAIQKSSSLVEHGGRPGVRRLGRLVRPRGPEGHERVGDPAVDSAVCTSVAKVGRRLRRPLRPQPAAAAAGDLAVRGAEPRRPHADRAGVGAALHREQLADRPHR